MVAAADSIFLAVAIKAAGIHSPVGASRFDFAGRFHPEAWRGEGKAGYVAGAVARSALVSHAGCCFRHSFQAGEARTYKSRCRRYCCAGNRLPILTVVDSAQLGLPRASTCDIGAGGHSFRLHTEEHRRMDQPIAIGAPRGCGDSPERSRTNFNHCGLRCASWGEIRLGVLWQPEDRELRTK